MPDLASLRVGRIVRLASLTSLAAVLYDFLLQVGVFLARD